MNSQRPFLLHAYVVTCVLLSLSVSSAVLASNDETLLTARPAFRLIGLTAFTRPRARLPLVSEVDGRIEEVFRDIGEPIGSDALFARIDDTFLRFQLKDTLLEKTRLADQVAFDEREVKRSETLAGKKHIAASQLDRTRQTLSNSTQAFQRAEVQLQILTEQIARTRVRAPPGWKVIERRIEPVQWVNAGERLGEVADFSTLLLPFALTPEQLTALRAMPQPLTVELPELGIHAPAAIYRINPALDRETRKILVDLALQQPIEPQRGGLRAELELELPDPDNLLIPKAAVHRGFEEHWVQPQRGDRVTIRLLGSMRIDGQDWLRARAPDLATDQPLLPSE